MRFLALCLGGSFGLLLCVLAPSKVVVALAGLALLVTIMNRPHWGLLLFAFFATSIPFTTVTLGVRTSLSEAMLMLTWVSIMWQKFLNRDSVNFNFRSGPESVLLTLMLFSVFPFVIGQIVIDAQAGGGIVNWVRWLMDLSVFFMVPVLLKDDARREQLIVALLLGTLCMLVISIGSFLIDRNAMKMYHILEKLQYGNMAAVRDIFSGNFTRMGSPWVHPNLTGGVLALFIPLALFYGWTRRGWRRLLGLSVTILGCAGIMFSISRGAILALTIMLIWLTYKNVPYSGRILGLGAILAVLLVATYPPLQDRLSTVFSSTNASTQIRFDEYHMFPEAVIKYPFGIGFKIDPPAPGLLGISNLWLNFWYKIGLVGMLLFILVTVRWWKLVRPRTGKLPITYNNALWLGSFTGLSAALLTGLFDHYYSFTYVLIALFWLLMGINIQQVRLHPDMPTGQKTIPDKPPLPSP